MAELPPGTILASDSTSAHDQTSAQGASLDGWAAQHPSATVGGSAPASDSTASHQEAFGSPSARHQASTALSQLASEPSSPIPIAGAASPLSPTTPTEGPPDPLDAAMLDALLQRASPTTTPSRFSVTHIIRDPELHKAARRELDGSSVTAIQGSGPRSASAPGSETSSCLDGWGHEAEVERQRAAAKAIDDDVAAESRVNRDLAGLLVERVDDSRRALEALLRFITAMAAAEHAYSHALVEPVIQLQAAARPSTSSHKASIGGAGVHADAPSSRPWRGSSTSSAGGGIEALQPVAQVLLPLPKHLASTHKELEQQLRGIGDGVRSLHEEYQKCSKEINSTATALHRGIDAGRHSLGRAFQEHKSVCEAFDAATAERPRSRSFIRNVDQDPWSTEGKLVQEHKALQGWQDRERDFLKGAFARVQALETRRLQLMGSTVEAMAGAYSGAMSALLQQLSGQVAATAATAADPERGVGGAAAGTAPPLVGEEGAAGAGAAGASGGGVLWSQAAEERLHALQQAAAEAGKTSEALAARQAEAIEAACQELFCSPEIIRQGEMSHWNARSSTWTNCHFVLTRAGFLHWFASMQEVHALDLLNLAKCQFEAGEAPIFNIVEGAGSSWLGIRSGRRATFKASSIEECCEWAIALREAIALASSRSQRSSGSGR